MCLCSAFSLDELLDGGLYAGELCELTGEAASGKTQVKMQYSFA